MRVFERVKTITSTYVQNQCEHNNCTYESVVFDFWLFEIRKNFKVCHECHELIYINTKRNLK